MINEWTQLLLIVNVHTPTSSLTIHQLISLLWFQNGIQAQITFFAIRPELVDDI